MLPRLSSKLFKHFTVQLPAMGFCLLCASVAQAQWSDANKIDQFAKRVSNKHNIPLADVQANLKAANFQPKIIESISKPVEHTITWERYRKIFLKEKRIQGGVGFIKENTATLQRAYDEFGVPPEIITAIIGVETRYGEVMGNYRVIDALTTLAFEYPKRSKFFTKELEHFLVLTREQKVDPLMPVGSYAGAMGFGQFMPSSYRSYAVDFDEDNVADIWTNKTDAIGSVANYFKRHGWRKGAPVIYDSAPVSAQTKPSKKVLNASLKPKIKAAALSDYGLQQPKQLKNSEMVAPFLFEGANGPEYVLGLKNFYVITRYNHSRLYALAVYQLAQEIKSAAATAGLSFSRNHNHKPQQSSAVGS